MMAKKLHCLWRFAFLIYVLLHPTVLFADKQVIGRIERVELDSRGFYLDARIDTGAENSSLHTIGYKIYKKRTKTWVKFEVVANTGRSIVMNKPVKRFVSIKRKLAVAQLRPAVNLTICIGKIKKQVEVNLVDRGNFEFQLLIGRTFLRGDFLVDVDLSKTVAPTCS